MKQVIFEYVQWQHNCATIYAALNDPKLKPTVPTVIKLTDGFSMLCVPHNDQTLAPATMSIGPTFDYIITNEVVLEATPAQHTGISENTLLKAIAITKDTSLAVQLIKD